MGDVVAHAQDEVAMRTDEVGSVLKRYVPTADDAGSECTVRLVGGEKQRLDNALNKAVKEAEDEESCCISVKGNAGVLQSNAHKDSNIEGGRLARTATLSLALSPRRERIGKYIEKEESQRLLQRQAGLAMKMKTKKGAYNSNPARGG